MAESMTPNERMAGYLTKVATGPKMSKNLTAEEAQDGLSLVLEGAVSDVRAALFLITTRMKLETVQENLGFWRALDQSTVKYQVAFDSLLQVADAFDGFQRVPYFGFYVLPLLAKMGLPAYGHSARPLPPKFGITFEDLLQNHYGVESESTFENRVNALNQSRFGFIDTRQCHPKLDALRDLRIEIVKRPMLATLEKLLMPLQAKRNFLATNYFHPGYEVSMLAVAKESGFDRVVIGNGMEGGTLYGVHKRAKVFIKNEEGVTEERPFDAETLYGATHGQRLKESFLALKEKTASLKEVAEGGESALKGEEHPAREVIASQAASLFWLLGQRENLTEVFTEAVDCLKRGDLYEDLMRYIEHLRG